MTENEISAILVKVFLKIHRTLGPGLLESVYEEIICYELAQHALEFKRQRGIKVIYEGVQLDLGFRADILVENKVLIEVKSIESVAPVHFKIFLTYLKLSGIRLGLLVNFNVELIKNGIHRVANNL
jgi:GxxExxY protein